MNNGLWRAYSKGSIELCEKYSAFIIQERAVLVDAPKDVRRLEALKPANTPSMRERYDAAVSKEKRLEAAANPVISSAKRNPDARDKRNKKPVEAEAEEEESSSDDEKFEHSESEEEDERSKHVPKRAKLGVVNQADLNNVKALEEEDVVQEGVVWSDGE